METKEKPTEWEANIEKEIAILKKKVNELEKKVYEIERCPNKGGQSLTWQ